MAWFRAFFWPSQPSQLTLCFFRWSKISTDFTHAEITTKHWVYWVCYQMDCLVLSMLCVFPSLKVRWSEWSEQTQRWWSCVETRWNHPVSDSDFYIFLLPVLPAISQKRPSRPTFKTSRRQAMAISNGRAAAALPVLLVLFALWQRMGVPNVSRVVAVEFVGILTGYWWDTNGI